MFGQESDHQGIDDRAVPPVDRYAQGNGLFPGKGGDEQIGQDGFSGFEYLRQLRRIAARRQGRAIGAQGIEDLPALLVDQEVGVGRLGFDGCAGDFMKALQFAAFERFGGGQHAQAGFHGGQFAIELDENLAGQALRLAGNLALFQLIVGQDQIGAERDAGQHADENQDEQAGA